MSEQLYYVKGVNGQLTVYDDKVVIERKGFLAFGTHGLAGAKTIPIASIQSVQFKAGGAMVNGFIQFGVLGGIEGKGGVFKATEDENTVMLRMGEQSDIGEKIKNYIEQCILERSKSQAATGSQTVSAADEVIKMKQLLDMGIITEEEFDRKKRELLGL
ncbi:MAG: SHOCT domain-containing protein [Prevotella sp.]|nr:SHOCT domain-containing protein [Prevotella sp.]